MNFPETHSFNWLPIAEGNFQGIYCQSNIEIQTTRWQVFSCIPDKDIRVLPGLKVLILPMLSHPGPENNHVY